MRFNPQAHIRAIDTVCSPTKDHQRALERLIGQVDAMIVVGGHNSNNTRQLTRLCREHNVPTCQVQSAADLDGEWLSAYQTVGLTAGTSTLDQTINEVERVLIEIGVNQETVPC